MSQPNEPRRDELEDRLMDQALREVLGGEAPPELSDKILAAADKQGYVSPQRKENVMDKSRTGYRLWALVAVAACLVVGVGIALTLPAVHSAREAARAPTGSGAEFDDGQRSAATPETGEEAAEVAKDHSRLIRRPESDPRSAEVRHEVVIQQAPPVEEPAREATTRPQTMPGDRADMEMYEADMGYDAFGAPAPADALAPGKAKWESHAPSELWSDVPTGRGPGRGGDKYGHLVDNPFRTVKDHPLSTFSIDVDTASYANVRRFLLRENRLPPPDAVRIEELVNYFDYDYAGPEDDVPFAAHIEVAGCPWKAGRRLVRVGLKGMEVRGEQRPPSNLVFLLDVSGSMNSPDKLPLLKDGMKLLAEQVREDDRVGIVVYAGSEGLVLPSTPGAEREKILAALERLQAGGSTNGGAGIELAYRVAQENFIEGGVNRVLLCTDGDFNVGTTSTGALVRMVEERAKKGVFLSVLGFGRGNLNDSMMEEISNKGNGNYAYVDSLAEARKVLVEQVGGTLVTIAKDVKIQIEFNPAQVAAYRLIGYANRMLAPEDFNDDKKDAGEIGAGHTVTALYELVPAGEEVDVPSVDPLKYQTTTRPSDESVAEELLTLKLRYKAPDGDKSKLLEFPVVDGGAPFGKASPDFQFAAAVASFGMLLRDSEHQGDATYDAVLEIATAAKGPDAHGYRAEFLDIVRRAKALAKP
jgi:Ca-activated chloride channel family protein